LCVTLRSHVRPLTHTTPLITHIIPQASKLRSEALKAKENALDLGSGGSPNTSWEVEQLKRLAINALEQGNHEQAVEVLERALTAEYFKIANIGDGAADDNLETKVALLHLLYVLIGLIVIVMPWLFLYACHGYHISHQVWGGGGLGRARKLFRLCF